MNVNELMIGDWVLVDYINSLEIGAMMPVRVKQIYECGIIIDCGEGDEECEIFKPIPLTAEILVKNGLQLIDVDLYRLFWSDEKEENYWSIVIDLMHPIGSRVESHSATRTYGWRGSVTFVHELQHILRQSKIDKEIIL